MSWDRHGETYACLLVFLKSTVSLDLRLHRTRGLDVIFRLSLRESFLQSMVLPNNSSTGLGRQS